VAAPTRTATRDATGQLVAHVASLDPATLPAEVIGQARVVVADTVGVLLGSCRRPAATLGRRAAGTTGGPCTVVGAGRVAAPETAALLNGLAAHDIELDDFHSGSRTHPGAVVVPAALATAELVPGATLGTVLAAVVAGYEVTCRLAAAIGPAAQFARGFHPSAVCGTVGAALCSGRVLGLSVDELRVAAALAAGQAGGLMTIADDPTHMAKSFQTGVAARNGVTAALFARAGYQAAPDVLTGRHTMLHPFGGDTADPSQLLHKLGTHYQIQQTSLKLHACCALTHPALDALLSIRAERDLAPDRVTGITAWLAHDAAPRIDGHPLWTHNIQYLLAVAAIDGVIRLEHLSPAWTNRPDVRALADRVSVAGADRWQREFPARPGAMVAVHIAGDEVRSSRAVPRGHPENPLSDADQAAKFAALADPVLGEAVAGRLWQLLRTGGLDEPARPVLDAIAEPKE
jgi:2-methylcitrate dehydratase PrpD